MRHLTQFNRLHLRGLRTHRLTALSAVLGVALGTSLVIATQLLTNSLTAPFESIPTALGADADLIEIRPVVADRLTGDLVAEIGDTAGVSGGAVLATMPSLARAGSREASLLLVAAFGDVGVLPEIATPRQMVPPDDGPTCGNGNGRVVLSKAVADALDDPMCIIVGAQELTVAGDSVVLDPEVVDRLQGGRLGFTTFDVTGRDQEGMPFSSVAYVKPSGDRDSVVDELRRKLGDRATVGDPSATIPPAIVTVRDALSSLAAGGVFIGALIAFNTLVLVITARIPDLATAIALGATRRSVLGGVIAEGALLGAAGGVIAVPAGLGLGWFLVDRFGQSILSGAGVDLTLQVDPMVLAGAPTTGALIGGLATFFAARRPLRRPLDHLGGAVDRTARGRVPRWLGPVGMVLVMLATGLMYGVGSGAAPVTASQVALVWGALGIALLAAAVIPPVARWALRRWDRIDAASARITLSEVQRVPLRIAMIVATVGLSAGMAASFAGLAQLAPATLADGFVRQLGATGRLTTAQRPWDPRFAALAPASPEPLDAPDRVLFRSRSYLPSETEPRLVMAIPPTVDAVRAFLDTDDPARVAAALAAGDVVLTGIAAERLGVGVGDRAELATIEGNERFRVGALVEVGIADDTTIGDWVVVASGDETYRRWAPAPVVAVGSAQSPSWKGALRYDADGYRAATEAGIGRYFDPFALTGWVYLVAAVLAVSNFLLLAMVTRRRERATLVVIGADDRVDRRAVLTQAVLQGVLAIAVYMVSVIAFTGWLSLSSPAFYGFRLDLGVSWGALGLGLAILIDGLALATVRPWLAATVTDPTPALRGE